MSRLPHVRNHPVYLAVPFELDPHHPTSQSAIMPAHARKARVSLFNDRIDILKRNAVETSPTYQVFRTVDTILALVRVCVLIPCPPVNRH